jgi:hypothetical protein
MDRESRQRRRRSQTGCLIAGLAFMALLIIILIVVVASLNRGFLQPDPLSSPLPPQVSATPALPVGAPTLEVLRVNPGQSITVQAANFPPGASVAVRIGPAEEQGQDGALVSAAAADETGGFTATFGLPAEFASLQQLIIRLDAEGDFFAWAQFLNE